MQEVASSILASPLFLVFFSLPLGGPQAARASARARGIAARGEGAGRGKERRGGAERRAQLLLSFWTGRNPFRGSELLGWCSWLSRVPHTHEVTSSILVSSKLLFFSFFFCPAVPRTPPECGPSAEKGPKGRAGNIKNIRAENRTRDLQCVRLT